MTTISIKTDRTCPTCGKKRHLYWFVDNGVRTVDGTDVTYYCSEQCRTADQL